MTQRASTRSRKAIPGRSAAKTRSSAILASIIGLLVMGAAAAWFYTYSDRTVAPLALKPITTGFIGEYAGLVLIAQDRGYFKEAGLDVTLMPYPSGPAAIADLLAGKLDTAMASDFAGVRNSFAGEDIKILATLSKSEAFDLIARRDHGINTAIGLRGRRIGVTRKTVGEFYLGQFLIFNKLSGRDVTIVDQPQDQLVVALKAGELDAAVLFEPNAYQAKKQLGANAVRWSVQADQSIYSLLYSTSKYTTKHSETVERYLRAVVRAEDYMRNHKSESQSIVAQKLGYTQEYIEYIWPKFSFVASLDQELLLNMDDEARWAIENRLTTSLTVPNYLRLLYLPALDAVKPQGITVIR